MAIQIQQIQSRKKHEAIVIITILAGMLIQNVLFNDAGFLFNKKEFLILQLDQLITDSNGYYWNHYFYTKYLVSFFRSAIIYLFVYKVMEITLSWRVTILMMFLLCSMVLDLTFVVSLFITNSSNIYDALKPIRYLYTFNFKSIYTYFEILCIVTVFINLIRIKIGSSIYNVNFNNNNKYSPSWLLHSIIRKGNYS